MIILIIYRLIFESQSSIQMVIECKSYSSWYQISILVITRISVFFSDFQSTRLKINSFSCESV